MNRYDRGRAEEVHHQDVVAAGLRYAQALKPMLKFQIANKYGPSQLYVSTIDKDV